MIESIQFFIPGCPAPGGSKKFVGFAKSTGRAILVDDAGKRNKNWRATVVAFAHNHRPPELLRCALRVRFIFVLPRPKYHFHTGKRAGQQRDDAPHWHTKKPDVLKLARSTEDALTGIIYADDGTTCQLEASKRYGDDTGCYVEIYPIL